MRMPKKCGSGVPCRALHAAAMACLRADFNSTCMWHLSAAAVQRVSRESSGGGADSSDAELAGGSVWLSATVEAEALSGSGSDALLDWRIVVAAPLAVDNQLPLRGSLLVWERPKARSSASLLCQSECEMQMCPVLSWLLHAQHSPAWHSLGWLPCILGLCRQGA